MAQLPRLPRLVLHFRGRSFAGLGENSFLAGQKARHIRWMLLAGGTRSPRAAGKRSWRQQPRKWTLLLVLPQ